MIDFSYILFGAGVASPDLLHATGQIGRLELFS